MRRCDFCKTYPAEVSCSTHKTHICGQIECIRRHRLNLDVELADLLNLDYRGTACEFGLPRRWEPMDWVVAIGAACVIAVGAVMVWSHL